MISQEYLRFEKLLNDLCVAFDKPISDERKRVFWETLRVNSLGDVEARIKEKIAAGGKFPSAGDLLTHRKSESGPENTYRPPKPEHMEPFHAHAQKCMLAFLWTHGAATEESLQAMIKIKNKLVSDFKLINTDDPVSGEEFKNALFKAWKPIHKPMPSASH